jgi:hypothetical protein
MGGTPVRAEAVRPILKWINVGTLGR